VVKPTIVETQPKPGRETGRGESRQARPLVRPMSR